MLLNPLQLQDAVPEAMPGHAEAVPAFGGVSPFREILQAVRLRAEGRMAQGSRSGTATPAPSANAPPSLAAFIARMLANRAPPAPVETGRTDREDSGITDAEAPTARSGPILAETASDAPPVLGVSGPSLAEPSDAPPADGDIVVDQVAHDAFYRHTAPDVLTDADSADVEAPDSRKADAHSVDAVLLAAEDVGMAEGIAPQAISRAQDPQDAAEHVPDAELPDGQQDVVSRRSAVVSEADVSRGATKPSVQDVLPRVSPEPPTVMPAPVGSGVGGNSEPEAEMPAPVGGRAFGPSAAQISDAEPASPVSVADVLRGAERLPSELPVQDVPSHVPSENPDAMPALGRSVSPVIGDLSESEAEAPGGAVAPDRQGGSPDRAFGPSPAVEEVELREAAQPSGRQAIAASILNEDVAAGVVVGSDMATPEQGREVVAPQTRPDAPRVVAGSETAAVEQGADVQDGSGAERVVPSDFSEAASKQAGLVGQTVEVPADGDVQASEIRRPESRLTAASSVSREAVAVQASIDAHVVPPSNGDMPEPVVDAQGQADSRRAAMSARVVENATTREAGTPPRSIPADADAAALAQDTMPGVTGRGRTETEATRTVRPDAAAPLQTAAGTQTPENPPAVAVARPTVQRPETPPVAAQPARTPERRSAAEFAQAPSTAPEVTSEASGAAQNVAHPVRRREMPQAAAPQDNRRATVLTAGMPEGVKATTVHSVSTPSSDPSIPVSDDVDLTSEAEGSHVESVVNGVHENAIPRSEGGPTAQPLQSDVLRPEFTPRSQPAATTETAAAGRADFSPASETLEDAYRINDQVVRGMRMFSRNGASQVTLRLDPPELGEVTIRLVTENRVLSGEIAVENREAHEVLQRHMVGLREALANQGIQVDRMEVSVDGRGTSGADRESSNPAWQDRSGNGAPDGRPDSQRRPFQQEAWPRRQPVVGDGRVDLTA